MATLPELLKTLVELGGSDLHITTSTPPQVRVHGHLQRLEGVDLSPSETKQLAYSVLTDSQKKRFEESLELDFPILSDPEKNVARAYGVVTPERQVAQRWTFYIGPDGKIQAVDRNIKVSTAAQDIAAKLGELGVAKKAS